MPEITPFTDKVLSKFSASITDKVFLMIQTDRELMLEYLELVRSNDPMIIHQQIGNKIKERFHLPIENN